ncbi:DMT family transporter [Desulfoprunum benzoelyticum]|uniref:RarD protein n=1 Tax=Desulfoprunum benzoelyticum TaxID=1506996 RepID=A0A840UTK9_9BACT|nr:DMT family transporter [Desulfoprunum benzoelyticum]MBB5349132.1 RarD protein [Desulfoprunum benzoelyticum]MBM9530630.1 DMT family transporter [Desulfoprunum benzoelyticum]
MTRTSDRLAPPAASALVGILYVALSAASFGALPIFIKVAYASGASTVAVLAMRFTFAALLMCVIMVVRRQRWPHGRHLIILIGMGGLGYVGQSYCFFAALNHASAGLVSLLLYLYPTLVTLLAAVFLRQPLNRIKLAAVLAALAGTALIIGGDAGGSLPGILLGIGAALIYSIYILVGSRILQAVGALPAATVIMIAAATVFAVLAMAGRPSLPQGSAGWMAIAAIALVSTVIAMVFFFAGLARLSAADAATVSTLEPLVTVILAALFLGESITPAKLFGGIIIITALVVLARSR